MNDDPCQLSWDVHRLALDDLEPTLLVKAMTERDEWRRFVSKYGGNTLGFAPKKLLDWRALERRAAQLHATYARWNAAYWGNLRELHTTTGVKHVWIVSNEWHSVLVFDGSCTTWKPAQELIAEHLPRTERDVLVVMSDQSRPVVRLKERANTFLRRWDCYHRAFTFAVECRLEAFINHTLKVHDRYGIVFEPAIFIIVGDEQRQYSVSVDHAGQISWLTGPVYTCG